MVLDAMKSDRLIGMVQPKNYAGAGDMGAAPVYDIGCAGKIVEFGETEDGRFLITLAGICRFKVEEELETPSDYRRIQPSWNDFKDDLAKTECLDIDRAHFKTMLEEYFQKEGMMCDWSAVDTASDNKLITCLSMVCPLEEKEKQALLEAGCCKERAGMFETILEMALKNSDTYKSQH